MQSKNSSLITNKLIESKDPKISQKTKNHSEGHNKITVLVIAISLLYSTGNVPYAINSLLSTFLTIDPLVLNITLLILYIYKSLTLFIFYYINTHYHNVLKSYINNLKGVFN